MRYTLFEQLKKVLEKDERLIADGELLRNRIVELARKNDSVLLKHLLADKDVKAAFFTAAGEVTVFDSERFVRFVNNKEFLPDSYTAFKNKIGLAEGDEFISEKKEVVLNWPYKDCVLEGGQTKEDAKRDEVFWNETLAPDQIHRLLEPKVFTEWKRIDAKGEHKLTELKTDENGDIKDNLIIKGNNLLALHSLKKSFAGKVKLIYIDPPYNTGNDDFGYNDRFNHSAWLTFMRNRLEIARELLTSDGTIYVQLDYNEVHYGKILMDEVFGSDNFQREIIWDITVLSGFKTIANNWIRGHESILFYSRNPSFKFNKRYQEHTKEYLDSFKKVDEKGRRYMVAHKRTRYLDEVESKGKPYGDVWGDLPSFQQIPTAGERLDFSGQKTEALVARIVAAATDPGDLILDFYAGSGTTGAVAHKMGRQWILCEQMDYVDEVTVPRLKKVLKGEQGGISKDVKWQGGGDFVYAELVPLNQIYVDKVKKAKTGKDLAKVWSEIQEKGFLSYKVDLKKFDASAPDSAKATTGKKDFASLSLTNQKRFILESLDYNQLYVNYSEIEDKDYEVSKEDKKANKEFYGK